MSHPNARLLQGITNVGKAELQEQLTAASKEVEDIREAKAREASDLLANAKERLEMLHSEVCFVICTPQVY